MIILDGIIVINKEKDYTSNDVVQIVKKISKEKVGHTGTLDPMATGVLPVLVGKGTLLSKYLINHDKIYTATVKLGLKTDTGDITGIIIEEKEVLGKCLDKEKVLSVLDKLRGEQQQVPPMYSAIKVNGKKLYEYARKGQEVEIEPRTITIYNTELISISEKDKEIKFKVECSKGTYIRTLCEKFAEELGTVGTMSALNREKVEDFKIEDAVTIDELKENIENEKFMEKIIIKIESFFQNKDEIVLSKKDITKFLNGVKLQFNLKDDIYRIYDENQNFIGTGIINNRIIKRDIVI